MVSGSIGLTPLVRRLGIPDRINYLEPIRLGPWNREASIACFDRLAYSASLVVEDRVAGAVYDSLGIGIPHHVQSFFAKTPTAALTRSSTYSSMMAISRCTTMTIASSCIR